MQFPGQGYLVSLDAQNSFWSGVRVGEKMYHAGGPITWFGRWKTVPPVAFHRADIQLVEGVMDVSRGDVLADTPGPVWWRG